MFDPNSMLRLLSGSEKPAKPILRGWTKSPALDDCYWCSVLPRLSVLDLSKSLIRASWRIQEVFKLQKYTKIRLQVLWNEPMICRSFWAAVGLFWMRRLPRGKNWSDQTLERNAACALWQVSKVHYTCQLRPIDLPAHFAWENKGLLPQCALNSSWIWWDHLSLLSEKWKSCRSTNTYKYKGKCGQVLCSRKLQGSTILESHEWRLRVFTRSSDLRWLNCIVNTAGQQSWLCKSPCLRPEDLDHWIWVWPRSIVLISIWLLQSSSCNDPFFHSQFASDSASRPATGAVDELENSWNVASPVISSTLLSAA